MIKSAYIHIPFCKKICSYCDFCKNYYNENVVCNYLNALENEINKKYKNDLLDTIYIGGGTPSALSILMLEKLFLILKKLNLKNNYEFTFECNYEDITPILLKILKNNKVNRLSIGIQTFNKKYSKLLNRKIDKEEMLEKINLSKKYFDNINIDLMYAIPGQNTRELKEDLSLIKSIDVSHISTYALILEDNTKLALSNIKEANDKLQNKMYFLIKQELEGMGYKHYELSNYCKASYESRHNLTYWNNDNYYGFGTGASGFIDNVRYDNTRSIFNYINGKTTYQKELIDNDLMIKDEVMLNLRKTKGINKAYFYKKYNQEVSHYFDYQNLVYDNFLIEDNENIYINPKYLFVSNSVILKMLDTFII